MQVISNFILGARFDENFSISESMLRAFSEITGDTNPLHLDTDFCATTRFRKPIAPGMLVACVFSKMISAKIPGPGAVYREQNLSFVTPVYPGDVLNASIEVLGLDEKSLTLTIKTLVRCGERVVIDGSAKVVMSEFFLRPPKN